MIDSKPSKTAPTPMSPEDHLRAQIERLRVQLLEVNKALGLDRDNTDNILRVATALRLRACVSAAQDMNTSNDIVELLNKCITLLTTRARYTVRWKAERDALVSQLHEALAPQLPPETPVSRNPEHPGTGLRHDP